MSIFFQNIYEYSEQTRTQGKVLANFVLTSVHGGNGSCSSTVCFPSFYFKVLTAFKALVTSAREFVLLSV